MNLNDGKWEDQRKEMITLHREMPVFDYYKSTKVNQDCSCAFKHPKGKEVLP